MKSMVSLGATLAAGMAMCVAAFAQTPGQTSAQSQAQAGAQGQPITIVGCIQREADYRRAHAAGAGGVAGTGVGAANEFVIADASSAPAASASTARSSGGAAGSPGAGSPAGTAGTSGSTAATPAPADRASTSTGTAYELTGPNEGRVASFVGQRVEISGTLKAAEVGAAGPTGGPTAGAPPRGVDVTSQDLQLRELEVASVRATTGTCAAQ
jgi:hypothetical protein